MAADAPASLRCASKTVLHNFRSLAAGDVAAQSSQKSTGTERAIDDGDIRYVFVSWRVVSWRFEHLRTRRVQGEGVGEGGVSLWRGR